MVSSDAGDASRTLDVEDSPDNRVSPGEDSLDDPGVCKPIAVGADFQYQWIEAEVTEKVNTVVRVRWETASPTRGQIRFGLPGDLSRTSPMELVPATKHTALMLGLHASTAYEFQVLGFEAGQSLCTEATEVVTGALPPAMPPLTLTATDSASGGEGYTVIPVFGNGSGWENTWTVIVDAMGEPVWHWPKTGQRAIVTRDRAGVAFMIQAGSEHEPGFIRRISFDGEEVTEVACPGIHTDFVEKPGGTVAALTFEVREFEGGTRKLLGEAIKEIAPNGTVTHIWSVFDDLQPDLTKEYSTGWYADDVEAWTHINGITYSESENAYYVTSRNLAAVFKVHQGEGLEWVLSEQADAFTSDPPVLLSEPHSVQRLESGLLVFNTVNMDGCSEAVEIELDGSHAKRVWSYQTADCLTVTVLGNAQRLENGNTMLVLSSSGQIDEVSPDGELVWRLNAGFGVGFGFSERVPSMYPSLYQ